MCGIHGHDHDHEDDHDRLLDHRDCHGHGQQGRPLRIGIGGPVGSGKTALVEQLVPRLLAHGLETIVVTNDIVTTEDAEHVRRTLTGILEPERVVGVETGTCPHTAVREDPTMNLAALEELGARFPTARVALVESGGDNLTLTFSRRLVDYSIYVIDQFAWRLDLAQRYGAVPINFAEVDPVQAVIQATGGRGVDVAMEAAWADHSVQQAADMARMGGRLVLVGIPGPDKLEMKHSTARRKGLTIRVSRRMKHVYPRAIKLVENGSIDLHGIVSHHFPLNRTPDAFELNVVYGDQVNKIVIDISG